MKKYIKMKRYMTKYLALAGGLLMSGSLSGCHLDDPVIPAEELYIRGFIKQYGLIDPTQDFSSAMQTKVTLTIPGRASVVNVYAQMGEDLYRVGCFAELEGTVELPVDVSEATETIAVDVDGVIYYTTPGGTVDVKSGNRATSRAGNARVADNIDPKSLWIDPENPENGWPYITAKNGETEATYGARQPIVIGNKGALSGAVKTVDDVTYFDLSTAAHIGANLTGYKTNTTALNVNGDAHNPGEIGNTANGSNVRFLIKNEDDALSAYSFTFRTASKNKADVRVILLGQHPTAGVSGNDVYVFMDSKNLGVEEKFGTKEAVTTNVKGKYTEWEVRSDLMPRGYYELIIIGMDSEANVDGDKTCGNWGFMKMQRIKKATDMKWILACEDLGTTDDFDFNDVVFSIEAVNTNTAAMKLGVIQWQVVENPADGTVIRPKAPSRDGEATAPANSANKTKVKVTALAAGGTLPIWLHFREEESSNATTGTSTGTDYIVCPYYDDGDRGCLKKVEEVAASELAAERAGSGVSGCSEWHRWFGENKSENMLNTGTRPHIKDTRSVTFYTKNVFSLENFCYLKFAPKGSEGELPYYFNEGTDLDPWSKKVLQWQWQQQHSQEVTFGFFLTVYEPKVEDSGSDIQNSQTGEKDRDKTVSHILSKSLDGLPPQMFLIPDCNPMVDVGTTSNDNGWRWPCERTDITYVYPNFHTWVENSYSYYGMNWFMLPKYTGDIYDLYPRDGGLSSTFEPEENPYDHSDSKNSSN